MVAAVESPHVKKEEYTEFFSKFPTMYEVEVLPGQDGHFLLRSVNTAKPGWGYKEDLDFRYYPMSKPGLYEIGAEAFFFRTDGKALKAAGGRVWVE